MFLLVRKKEGQQNVILKLTRIYMIEEFDDKHTMIFYGTGKEQQKIIVETHISSIYARIQDILRSDRCHSG